MGGGWEMREHAAALPADEAKEATLTVLRHALLEGRIVPGEFVDQDEDTAAFVVWQRSVDETLARIAREWTALGRDPNPGEVVCLVSPSLLPVTAYKHPMGRDSTPKTI